jgi:hypothetical protein
MDHTNRLGQGPVYEISKVSQTSLPLTITNLPSPQRRHVRHPFSRPPSEVFVVELFGGLLCDLALGGRLGHFLDWI